MEWYLRLVLLDITLPVPYKMRDSALVPLVGQPYLLRPLLTTYRPRLTLGPLLRPMSPPSFQHFAFAIGFAGMAVSHPVEEVLQDLQEAEAWNMDCLTRNLGIDLVWSLWATLSNLADSQA